MFTVHNNVSSYVQALIKFYEETPARTKLSNKHLKMWFQWEYPNNKTRYTKRGNFYYRWWFNSSWRVAKNKTFSIYIFRSQAMQEEKGLVEKEGMTEELCNSTTSFMERWRKLFTTRTAPRYISRGTKTHYKYHGNIDH